MFPEFQLSRLAIATAIGFGSLVLSGCGGVITKANTAVDDTTRAIEDANARAELAKTPTVSTTDSAWLMGDSVVAVAEESPVLSQRVTYGNPRKVTLADVASYITQSYGLPVDISDLTGGNGLSGDSAATASAASGATAAAALPMPPTFLMNAAAKASAPKLPDMVISFDGTMSGLLDVVAQKEGVWWRFVDGRVEFYRTMTKTIYLPALSRHSNIKSSIVANGGPQSGVQTGQLTSSSSSSTGADTGSSTIASDYDIDFWKDIEKTAKTVAGGSGQGAAIVTASASLGGVTVTGTPTQVRAVEQWAKPLAENLSQMVRVTVTLYTVTLNAEDNYAWNPQVVFNKLGSAYGLSLSGPTIPSIASGLNPLTLGAQVLKGSSNSLAGSQAVFNALSTMGKVSNVRTWSTLATNGQVATVQLANQITYAASVGTTSTANVGTSSTITPGVVTTGLTGTVQPRIVNGQITLAMDLTDSVLNGPIGKFDSGSASIQEPAVSVAALPSSITLAPGTQMLATGVAQHTDNVTQTGTGTPGNAALGGGTDGNSAKTLTAVLISAEVM